MERDTMSVRPSEVAEGAQRFSLRRVFKALEASSSEELPAPTAGSTAAFAPPATACSAPAPAPVPASATPPSLTVDLGLRPPTKAHVSTPRSSCFHELNHDIMNYFAASVAGPESTPVIAQSDR